MVILRHNHTKKYMEKISFVIPVYNSEKYLVKCLDSVIDQDYEDIEIIIIDDGSNDTSREIIDEYKKKYSDKVFVICQQNLGVGSARTNGLKYSTGKWITFLDSDDWIEKTYCSDLLKLANKTDADIVCCNYVRDYINKSVLILSAIKEEAYIDIEKDIEDIFEEKKIKNNTVHTMPWGKLIKKEVIKDIVFDKDIFLGDDLLFNVMLLNNKPKIYFLNKYLYRYRQTATGLTKKVRNKNFDFYKNDTKLYISLKRENIISSEKLIIYYLNNFLKRDIYNSCIRNEYSAFEVRQEYNLYKILSDKELKDVYKKANTLEIKMLCICILKNNFFLICRYYYFRQLCGVVIGKLRNFFT